MYREWDDGHNSGGPSATDRSFALHHVAEMNSIGESRHLEATVPTKKNDQE